jgi:hypothetical protein
MAQRQIDDVQVERSLVRDGELERAQHVARAALSVVVKHSQRDDARPGRHADVDTGNQTGDVRAVSEWIERSHGLNVALGEIVKCRDTILEFRPRGNARINQRDTDAAARACHPRVKQGVDRVCQHVVG